MFHHQTKVSGIPLHHRYHWGIHLLPGTTPPCNHIYPRLWNKQKIREEYVQEALAQDYICPPTCPAGAGFFLWSLCPCGDYRGLNQNTAVTLRPCSTQWYQDFTRLDLHRAYNLVWVHEGNEWKTAFSATSGSACGLTCESRVVQRLNQWCTERC